MQIEPAADVPARVTRGVEDEERHSPTRLSAVAGELEANDSGSIQSFDERDALAYLTEALDFCSHIELLFQIVALTVRTGSSRKLAADPAPWAEAPLMSRGQSHRLCAGLG